MDPPPPSNTPTPPPTTTTTTTTAPTTYPDSVDSSPRSRATDYDDPFSTSTPKLRLMCSYGGHIVPRPHDKSLCYVGGDTRMVVVDRASTLPDLSSRLSKTLLNGRNFTLKYQLPNEDLDSLITLSSEEDLDNTIDEYDRLFSSGSSGKSSRIRLFLFPSKPEPAQSIGSLLDGSNRSEDWFLNALNGAAELQCGFSDPTGVNSLLGLDQNGNLRNNFNNSELGSNHGNSGGGVGVVAVTSKEMEMMVNHGSEKSEKLGNQNNNNQSNPDIQSVPDSPIIETTSSFGSTSSSPSLANMPSNLPPIRVHVEEGGSVGARVMDQRGVGGSGIEEQFAQMGVNVQKQQLDDQGYLVNSSPSTGVPASMMGGVQVSSGLVMGPGGGEYANRTVSDDERSDHGGRKQQQMGQSMMVMTSQPHQKHASGSDLPSPDSVSSDSSFSNTMSRPKQVMYQDPNAQLSSGNNRLPQNMIDPNTRMQMQQVSESGYVLPPQYDQQQLQLLQHQQQQHQQQQHQHQQQLLQQQHQQQQHHQQHQQQQHHQKLQQAQHQQQQAQHQHQQQQAQHQHQQQQAQHQQAQTTQTQLQAQQYIPAGTHYMHHPHPSAVPMQAYYSVYPPQQSHHHPHQYPVYYVPAGQAPQGYSLPVQQQQQQQPPNLGEPAISNPSVRPQTPPNPTVIAPSSVYNPQNVAPPKPEMDPGVYRTIPSAGPQLIQVPSNQPPQSQPQPPPQSQPQPQPPPPSQSQPQPPQHQPQPQQQQQFMGYSQIHHPSQSIAPGSTAGGGNYAYEFADPARSQIYFTQPLAPTLSAQYNQGIASGPAMVLPDGSQIPNENVKQQIRSSQPL